MGYEFEGSAEEIRSKAEQIVQAIAPEAKCEIWDYEHRIRCGFVDADGKKHEFSLVLGGFDRQILEANAKALTRLR